MVVAMSCTCRRQLEWLLKLAFTPWRLRRCRGGRGRLGPGHSARGHHLVAAAQAL